MGKLRGARYIWWTVIPAMLGGLAGLSPSRSKSVAQLRHIGLATQAAHFMHVPGLHQSVNRIPVGQPFLPDAVGAIHSLKFNAMFGSIFEFDEQSCKGFGDIQ